MCTVRNPYADIIFTHRVFFLHKKAICAVHSLLCSHDADPRYNDPQVRAHVAQLYLPLIPIVMETLHQLHDFSGQHNIICSPLTLLWLYPPPPHIYFILNGYYFLYCTAPESAFLLSFFLDSSPARVRHASAHADDADPDSGNTISQSVAMAIAGSPLPHVKANPFALPTVVSDSVSRGQAVPVGPCRLTGHRSASVWVAAASV